MGVSHVCKIKPGLGLAKVRPEDFRRLLSFDWESICFSNNCIFLFFKGVYPRIIDVVDTASEMIHSYCGGKVGVFGAITSSSGFFSEYQALTVKELGRLCGCKGSVIINDSFAIYNTSDLELLKKKAKMCINTMEFGLCVGIRPEGGVEAYISDSKFSEGVNENVFDVWTCK